MVDLETTGTQPEHANIIQIAAVRFNHHTGDVDPNVFNQCLMPLPTRFWDEDTRRFWSSHQPVLERIYGRMRDPKTVLQEFSNWVRDGFYGDPVLWAKPVTFEFPFLQSYFRELEVLNPFHFRRTVDLRSFLRGLYFPNPAPELDKEIEFEGDVHDALFDTFHQVKVVLAGIERAG